jgi:hypothetical protein
MIAILVVLGLQDHLGRIDWEPDPAAALQRAREGGRTALLYFGGDD